MNKTKIDWVKNPDGTQGYTWNPITGCLNGCEYCYARKLANTRLKERYLANKYGVAANERSQAEYYSNRDDPFYPRFWPERLSELGFANRGPSKPKGIFVCDMGELFGDWLPEEWTQEVLRVIKQNNNYRFYLLTKQPQNLPLWSPFPDNCWVGQTLTGKENDLFKRMDFLGTIEAKIKFISFEPLKGSITRGNEGMTFNNFVSELTEDNIDWLIIGALTGTKYEQPKIEWVEEIVRAADKAGVKVFMKDNLRPLLENQTNSLMRFDRETLTWELRQEMPK